MGRRIVPRVSSLLMAGLIAGVLAAPVFAGEPTPEFKAWWVRAVGEPGAPPNIDGVMFRIIQQGDVDSISDAAASTDIGLAGQLWVWKQGDVWRCSMNMTQTATQDVAWNKSVAWSATPNLLTVVPQSNIEISPFRYDALGGGMLGEIYNLITLGLYEQIANNLVLKPRMTSLTTWEMHLETTYLQWTSVVIDASGTWDPERKVGRIRQVHVSAKNSTESGDENHSANEWVWVPKMQLDVARNVLVAGVAGSAPHRVTLLEAKEFDSSEMERLVARPRFGDRDPLRGERRFAQIDDMTSRRWKVSKFDKDGKETPIAHPTEHEEGMSARQTVSYIVGGTLLLGLGTVAIARLRAGRETHERKETTQ